ncbi:hypothetical protein BT63DRAFT_420005 [Microthyrium microscopicum]|uniref:Developmental regulatory protein wetA n=1 Tax=Microthyrium microscopicum TaxID=703497 RepID=A0A6A6USI4_9PEZI|nr:hypothetical protein BT63DRAFT_420005 [Microthyrium microscopicum]
MAFFPQPLPLRPFQKALTLDENFDDIFNDFINSESIDIPLTNDAHSGNTPHHLNKPEPTKPNQHLADTSIILSNNVFDDAAIESKLWKALQHFADEDNEAALSSPSKAFRPNERPPVAEADVHSLAPYQPDLSEISSHAPLDDFLPSPPQSPHTSPSLPLSHQFGSLAIRRRNQTPPSKTTSRIQKSPRTPGYSPKMKTQSNRSAEWGRRMAGTDPMHMNFQHMGGDQMISPPSSASYKQEQFSDALELDSTRQQLVSPLPTGYGGHPNTPVSMPFFDERSTSGSSLSSNEASNYAVSAMPSGMLNSSTSPQIARLMTAESGFQADDEWWSTDSSAEIPQNGPHNMADKSGLGILGLSNSNPACLPMAQPIGPSHQASRPMPIGSRPTPNTIAPASLMVNGSDRAPPSAYSASASSSALPYCAPLPIYEPARWPTQLHNGSPYAPYPNNRLAQQQFPRAMLRQQSRSPQPMHRRNKSTSQLRRRSQGAPAKSPRHASMGFVNFTPSDSAKILTGVAPSGSSKTKARREKEAADKRRKQLEVATKAVERAGGDVTMFVRETLMAGAMEGV